MSRDEWLEKRSRGIGGSDVGSILGFNHWASPHDVWITKKPVRDALGLPPNVDEMNEVQLRGTLAEEPIGRYWGKRNSKLVGPAFEDIYAHPEKPIIQASIDMEVYDKNGDLLGLLEIKSLNDRSPTWKNGPPPKVWFQVQQYLYVKKEYPRAFVVAVRAAEPVWRAILSGVISIEQAVDFGMAIFEDYVVERDSFYGDSVIPSLIKWWDDYVTTATPPPADGTPGCSNALMKRFSNRSGVQELTDELEILARERQEHAEKEAFHSNERKTRDNAIRQILGNNKSAKGEKGSITISRVTRQDFNKKAFKAEHPELFEEFLKENSHERLTISGSLKEEQ